MPKKKSVKVKTVAEDIGDLSVAASQHQRFMDQSVRDDDVPDVRRGKSRRVDLRKGQPSSQAIWDPIEVQPRDLPHMPQARRQRDALGKFYFEIDPRPDETAGETAAKEDARRRF